MAVLTGCAECGKKYRVDDKFIGKKIRCKNCQAVISVQAEPAAVAASAPVPTKPRAKTTPAVAKKRPPSSGQPRRTPQPEALDLPDLSGLDVPSGPALQLDEQEATAAADPACPGCGSPFPAANRVCMNCGYNRGSGQKARTRVEKTAPLTYASGQAPRTSGGVRVWQAYESPFLNYLDVAIPRAAMLLFFGLGLLAVVLPIALVMSVGGTVPATGVAGLVLFVSIWMAMFYGIVLKITMYGVKLAAGIFKFEVPEDGRARLIGIHMVAALAAAIIIVIGVIATGALGHGALAIGTLLGTLLMALGVYLVLGVMMFQLLFHLKILEAIPGYLLMFVFYFIGCAVNSGILLVVGNALKAAFGGHAR